MENNRIVMFESDERSLNYMFEKFADKLTSTKVLSLEFDSDKFTKEHEIIGQAPEIGSVYFKHPYKPNCYVDSSNSDEYYFMQEKIEVYGKVAQLLGATKFEADVTLESMEKMTFGANGDFKYKVVKMNSDLKQTETNKITQRLVLKRNLEIQSDYDQKAKYVEAYDFVKNYNFTYDPSLNGLVESRDPSGGTLNKYQILKSELTSDYNKLLEFSAGLNAMGGIFNLNMGFSKKFESIKKVNLEMTIYF